MSDLAALRHPTARRPKARAAGALLVATLLASACRDPNPLWQPRDGATTTDAAAADDARATPADVAAVDGPPPDGPPPDGPPPDGPPPDTEAAIPPPPDTAAPEAPPSDTMPLDVAVDERAPCPGAGSAPTDEDGDGVPDACDNCPITVNADQTNTGETAAGRRADGLGDACDPRPDQAGDELAFFDGFSGQALDPRWTGSRSAYTVAGGALVFDKADDTTNSLHPLQREGVPRNVVVEAHVTATRFDTTASNDARNLWVGAWANSSSALMCSARREPGEGATVAVWPPGNTSSPNNVAPARFNENEETILRMRVEGASVRCTVGSAAVTPSSGTSLTPRDGRALIGVRMISGKLWRIAVYAIGP